MAGAAPDSIDDTTMSKPIGGQPSVPSDIHADVICVLANMAMALSPQEHS